MADVDPYRTAGAAKHEPLRPRERRKWRWPSSWDVAAILAITNVVIQLIVFVLRLYGK